MNRCPRCGSNSVEERTDAMHQRYRSCWMCGWIEELDVPADGIRHRVGGTVVGAVKRRVG